MRLGQIVTNLLDNAVKYTPPEGQVWVTVTSEDDRVTLRVRDAGVGIGPELLPRVFDLFVQADRSLDRSKGGLGLGLTLVRRLVHLHGGRVSAPASGIGRGSEFIVTLPLRQGVAEPERPEVPAGLGRRRVLIVEHTRTRETACGCS